MTDAEKAAADKLAAEKAVAEKAAADKATADAAAAKTGADTAVTDAVAAERKRAADILAACQMVGKADKATAFIAENKSLSEVVAALQADRSAAADVSARNNGAPGDKKDLPKAELNAGNIYAGRAKARAQRVPV